MYLCLKKNKNPSELFSTHKHMKSAETKVNLCDVFAHFYKQDIKTETYSEFNLIKYLVQSWAFDI